MVINSLLSYVTVTTSENISAPISLNVIFLGIITSLKLFLPPLFQFPTTFLQPYTYQHPFPQTNPASQASVSHQTDTGNHSYSPHTSHVLQTIPRYGVRVLHAYTSYTT